MTRPSRFSFRPIAGYSSIWRVVRRADDVEVGTMSRIREGYETLAANHREGTIAADRTWDRNSLSRETCAGLLASTYDRIAATPKETS